MFSKKLKRQKSGEQGAKMITVLIIALFTGVFTKLADDFSDRKLTTYKPWLFFSGIIYGSLIGYMITSQPAISSLWLAAVIGNLLFGRVNALSHYAAIAAILVVISIAGMVWVDIILVVIFSIVCFTEELIHDMVIDKKLVKNKFVISFVEIRPLLEIASFVFSLATGLWITWFALLSFDAGYLIVKYCFK